MRRLAITAISAVVLTLPAASNAEYYFTDSGAQRVTKDLVHKLYGLNRYTLGVYCRPQGADRGDPAFKYHRWACAWAARQSGLCTHAYDSIYGQVLIVGRSGRGTYSYRVLHGEHCDK